MRRRSTKRTAASRLREPDRRRMEDGIREFLEGARGGPLRGEIARTPARVARAWAEDLLSGYREEVASILSPLRSERSRDLVAVRGIEFVSTCAHHLLPFHGVAHLAYLPDGRITGISRLPKLVRCLTRRLQIQEELTRQIVDALDRHLAPRGAACVIEATHLCMISRGNKGSTGLVVTAAFSGCLEREPSRRGQILALLRGDPRPPRRRPRR